MATAAPTGYPQRVDRFTRSVSRRLLLWSGLSMIAGAALWWRGNAFWRAFGIQAAVWGAIDALIAAAGLVGARQRAEQALPAEILPAPPPPAETPRYTAAGGQFAPGKQTAAVDAAAVDAAAKVADAAVAEAEVAAVRSARRLARLLWFNTLLDVGYVAGGAWLARTKGRTDPAWRGHGWGIIVQGTFLFAFDLAHALRVPKKENHP